MARGCEGGKALSYPSESIASFFRLFRGCTANASRKPFRNPERARSVEASRKQGKNRREGGGGFARHAVRAAACKCTGDIIHERRVGCNETKRDAIRDRRRGVPVALPLPGHPPDGDTDQGANASRLQVTSMVGRVGACDHVGISRRDSRGISNKTRYERARRHVPPRTLRTHAHEHASAVQKSPLASPPRVSNIHKSPSRKSAMTHTANVSGFSTALSRIPDPPRTYLGTEIDRCTTVRHGYDRLLRAAIPPFAVLHPELFHAASTVPERSAG